MQLPTDLIEPTETDPKFLFMYGQRKVGKTEALAKLTEMCPEAFIIEADPNGAKYVRHRGVHVTNLSEYLEVCRELTAQKKHKIVCLDTSTMMEEWCEPHATEMYRKSTQGKNFPDGQSVLTVTASDGKGNSFSPGYQWLRMSFGMHMSKLMLCAPYIICTGHIKDKMLGVKDNEQVSALDIDHTGKIKLSICAGADAIGYLYRSRTADGKHEKLWISFQTNSKEFTNTGTRIPRLANQSMEFDWKKIYSFL